ncbi:hypothetical protein HD554DRAFT_2038137 [Boletus coccyginus]|nr:hypothetical protein HD554DRAFT_2038137 [Boletus coccyginus]
MPESRINPQTICTPTGVRHEPESLEILPKRSNSHSVLDSKKLSAYKPSCLLVDGIWAISASSTYMNPPDHKVGARPGSPEHQTTFFVVCYTIVRCHAVGDRDCLAATRKTELASDCPGDPEQNGAVDVAAEPRDPVTVDLSALPDVGADIEATDFGMAFTVVATVVAGSDSLSPTYKRVTQRPLAMPQISRIAILHGRTLAPLRSKDCTGANSVPIFGVSVKDKLTLSLGVAVRQHLLTVNYVVQDGQSNWLEGMILICLTLFFVSRFGITLIVPNDFLSSVTRGQSLILSGTYKGALRQSVADATPSGFAVVTRHSDPAPPFFPRIVPYLTAGISSIAVSPGIVHRTFTDLRLHLPSNLDVSTPPWPHHATR